MKICSMFLDKAAEVLGYKKNDYEFVRYPERELTVSIPITMDDGHVEVFSGYRVQHNTARGAAKRRYPLPSRF